MSSTYATFPVPDIYEEPKVRDRKTSMYFDFKTGDFVVGSTGKIRESDYIDTWIQWCLKAVYTQRYAHLAYTKNYGSELEKALQMQERALIEGSVERTIQETILADALHRTSSVRNFEHTWETDALNTRFVVVGQDGRSEALNVKIPLGGGM